jgi:MATE family multidrug resistance protein
LLELCSVRVSNELGANRPKAANFAVIMAVSTSAAIGAVFLAVFLIWRTELPRFFSDNEEVVSEAGKLGYLLAATIFLNSIQPVLSGTYQYSTKPVTKLYKPIKWQLENLNS